MSSKAVLADEAGSFNRNGSPQKGGKSGSVITTVFLPKSILNGPLPLHDSTTITSPAVVKTATPIKVVQVKATPQVVKSGSKALASTSQSIAAHRSSAPSPFKAAATPSPSQKVGGKPLLSLW